MTSDQTAPAIEQLLVGADQAARLLGIGRSLFYQMHSAGQLGPMPISFGGKCKRWATDELRQWVRSGCPHREKWLKLKEEKNGQSTS